MQYIEFLLLLHTFKLLMKKEFFEIMEKKIVHNNSTNSKQNTDRQIEIVKVSSNLFYG